MDEMSQTSSQVLNAVEEPQNAKSSPKDRKKHDRARKVLKQSVIRRICQVPKPKKKIARKSTRKTTNKASKKAPAEVHYTNSQFGLAPIPCTESGCNSCILAPSNKGKLKRPGSVENGSAPKPKRLCTECKAVNQSSAVSLFVSPNETTNVVKKDRYCICTEFNGHLYKLIDETADFENVGSILQDIRRLRERKPHLATKRNVAKKPAVKKPVEKKQVAKKTCSQKP